MKKIDLNELYGGSWSFFEEGDDGGSGSLEIKPLREHLEEWIQQDDYICIHQNRERIQDILDGRITEVDDDVIGFFFINCFDAEDEETCWYYDEVILEPFSYIKKKKAAEAREQGIKPRECWYRKELDKLFNEIPF